MAELINDEIDLDRRRFIKRMAVAAAWTAPVIMTLSSKAAHAQTVGTQCGVKSGNACVQGAFPACNTGLTCLVGPNPANGQPCLCA
jgi:hypothetical protein